MDGKSPFASKTLWLNLIMAILSKVAPGLLPAWATPLLAVANFILRFFTKAPLVLAPLIARAAPSHKE